ncbi:SO_0444 family Cu/Zn efflux transporter [Desulfocastanea catecholica]
MLPAAASLSKQGANKGAVSAFLISTPESGVDSIAITYALLDPVMTIVRPVAAFLTAMVAGLAENLFFWQKNKAEIAVDRSCPVDGCCDGLDCPEEVHAHHHSLVEKLVAGVRFGYREVWGDIVGWFFIGVFLAGLITTLVPDDLMATLLGGGLSSMLVMLVVGVPLYICATASTPVAAALIMKGVSPGAALVFLLVGPATNITSLSVLMGILGKRSTLLYLTVLSACAVLFGLGIDMLYHMAGISPRAIIGEASELVPDTVKLAAVILLLGLSVKPLMTTVRKKLRKKPVPTTFISPFPSVDRPLKSNVHQGHKEEEDHCSCCK